jgi:hypothetical protein
MANLPTPEEFSARLEQMPESLLNAIQSEETVALLSKIGDDFGLEKERLVILSQLIGLVVSGFAEKEELKTLVSNILGVDGNVSSAICTSLEQGLFGRIQNDLDAFLISLTSAADEPLRPQIQPIETPVAIEAPSPTVAPFVIHEHEEVEGTAGAAGYAEGLARPSFHASDSYEPPTGGYADQSRPTARLELGGEPSAGIYIEPKTTRIGKEDAKIIHYTTPDMQTDPFSTAPRANAEPSAPTPRTSKPTIPPSNVVNLKDLPK